MIIRVVVKNRKTGDLVEVFETAITRRTKDGKFISRNQLVFEHILSCINPTYGRNNFVTIENIERL